MGRSAYSFGSEVTVGDVGFPVGRYSARIATVAARRSLRSDRTLRYSYRFRPNVRPHLHAVIKGGFNTW